MFPALVQNWRQAFNHTTTATATDTNTGTAEEVSGSGRSADDGASSDIFFGFIQLSTWCFGGSPSSPYDINAIPYMREAQMAAATLPTVGWATNADKGDGCNIHPPAKQFCAHRLAAASLALRYSTPRSPSPSPAPPAPAPPPATAAAPPPPTAATNLPRAQFVKHCYRGIRSRHHWSNSGKRTGTVYGRWV